jgi:PKD repeat protein
MKTKLLFITCFLVISLVKAQIISTIAGNDKKGYSGDGGQVTAAEINGPISCRSDAMGNIYFSDALNNRIRKISTSGIITTIAGNGTVGYSGDGGQATSAAIYLQNENDLPDGGGIAIDVNGNIFISDYGNNAIRKINTLGIISTVVGTGVAGFNGDNIPATAAELERPNGITFDTYGNLYIADGDGNGNNERIRKVNTAGIISTVAGNGTGGYGGNGGQATATELNNPCAIAFDVLGNMYIADGGNNRIRMVNTAGVISNIAGSGPTGLYKGSYSGDGGRATDAMLNMPCDIIFDAQGNMYIADAANECIRKINTSGIINTIAGNGVSGYSGDGGPASKAKICYPSSTFLDLSGNLYIADYCNNRIRKVGCSITVPDADFQASTTSACVGVTIAFSDSTTNTIVSGWQWSFPGGTLANGSSFTDSIPKVIYTIPGNYAVSYTATNSAGQASITKIAYIHIPSATAKYNSAFEEGFEATAVPGTDWAVSSSRNANWMITSTAAASGAKSVMIDNITNAQGDTSILTGPTFDLAAIGSPVLSFDMAYQQTASTNTDKLQVYVSSDCGASWVSKWARSGAGLQPATVNGQSTNPFTPQANQFTTYVVNINSTASGTNAMFRWVFYAGASSVGNNIYLDNINVYQSATGIKDIETAVDLNIYPNPSFGIVNIAFTLAEKHSISVQVVDMLGRVVETITAQSYGEGETILSMGKTTVYQAGVYFVNINIDGQSISKKVIIQ